VAKNQWQYWQPAQNKVTLMVPDEHGNMVPIQCLATSDARRALGVRITLDGNNKEEATYLTGITKEWGEK